MPMSLTEKHHVTSVKLELKPCGISKLSEGSEACGVKVNPSGPLPAGAYPGFHSMKQIGALLLLLDEMLVHCR